MTINIDGVDKTNLIDWKSFEMTNVLTKEVDTLVFSLRVHPGQTYEPAIGKEVTVYIGAKIYGGIIVEIERTVEAMIQVWRITCKDYHQILDRKLVSKTYSGQLAGDIVKNIISVYTSGFTVVNVANGIPLDKITFNYEQVSRAIQQVADRINYDWYVDENKDIHFFSKEDYPAPFELNDTGGNFIWNSLMVNRHINQVKNSIYVRGGVESLGFQVFKIKGDGSARAFSTQYELTNLTVKKGGVVQTLGKDGVSDPASVDVLYNPDYAFVKFREDNKPGNGVEVEISGDASIPIVVYRKDAASIALYGEYQFRIIDKSITTPAEAAQRALAELEKYKNDTNEVVFKTRSNGLKVGQRIRLNSVILGIDKYFTIKRIISRVEKPTTDERIYEVALIGSEQLGIIDVLARLLITEPNKAVEIAEDEIIDTLISYDDDFFTLTDQVPVFSIEVGPWYVSGGVGTPVGYCGYCEAS